MTSSYAKRKLDLTFQLGQGDFGESSFDSVKLTGLRVSANIVKGGSIGMGAAHLRVFGMKLSTMNKLNVMPLNVNEQSGNKCTIEAGDELNGMQTLYIGNIYQAYADFNGVPDVAFNVMMNVAQTAAIKPVPPTTFKGTVNVADAIKAMADKAGLGFENNGVDVRLPNPYWPGTARQQMLAAAKAADINLTVDKDVVAIWPRGKPRGDQIPLMSNKTGMVGYPSWTTNGVTIKCLYMPHIDVGTLIKVESIVEPANKQWQVQAITYNLDSEMPNGQWFQTLECYKEGQVALPQAQ